LPGPPAEWLPDRPASSRDASSSKPDPDIIHAALQRAHADAHDAVMLGDTPYDVEAASRASVPTIALLSGVWGSEEDLAGAVERWESVSALVDGWERSLLGNASSRR